MAGATFSGTVILVSEWVAVVAVDAHDCQCLEDVVLEA